MAATSETAREWKFLLTPRWLCWHAFAVVAALGMFWLGDWQLHRAESGNELSWAYTFEWPLFAVLGLGFWAKSLCEEIRLRASAPDGSRPEGPAVGQVGQSNRAVQAGQPGAETEAYLARLQAEARGHGRWHGWR
jgi:hypothetical protein